MPILNKIVKPQSSIPIITLTEPDDEPWNSEDEYYPETKPDETERERERERENKNENVVLPEIAVSPPSPRPCRKAEINDHFTEEEEEIESDDLTSSAK